MSLESKINSQFDSFFLKAPDPKQNHPWNLEHLHADFIELRALLWDNESFITLQDVITYYKDYQIKIEIAEESDLDSLSSSSVTEINDKWNSKFENIFFIIEERDLIYKDYYPFEIGKNKIKLKNDLTDIQKLYLYLLISSNLNNFKKLKGVLTSEFETLSKNVLEKYFPKMTVEEFGENSDYKGNTRAKIKALSKKLNIDVRKKELENISPLANKEKGLDLVGWMPFNDSIANMVSVLGQCACGKDWTKKKADTSPYSDSYLDFNRLQPIHSMFIPYSLINIDDTLYQSDQTNGKLFFERNRIVGLISEEITLFTKLDSLLIVNKCIDYKEIEV